MTISITDSTQFNIIISPHEVFGDIMVLVSPPP